MDLWTKPLGSATQQAGGTKLANCQTCPYCQGRGVVRISDVTGDRETRCPHCGGAKQAATLLTK